VCLQKFNVMSKNTSITLGNYFDQFIQGILREGRYKNASEVVRAGLSFPEKEEQKIITHPQAIFPTRVACLPPSNWADKKACKMSIASSSLIKRAGKDKMFASLC